LIGYTDIFEMMSKSLPQVANAVIFEICNIYLFFLLIFETTSSFIFFILKKKMKHGGGVPYSVYDHDGCGNNRLTSPSFKGFLVQKWIPSIPGLKEKFEKGINVADIGCGHGVALIAMAKGFFLSFQISITFRKKKQKKKKKKKKQKKKQPFKAFPNSKFLGLDLSENSIAHARIDAQGTTFFFKKKKITKFLIVLCMEYRIG